MKNIIAVAARPTELAVAQTSIVIDALKKKHPDLKFEIIKIFSKGDKDKRTALWHLKQTGFFTSLLEDTLLAGAADIAVHSFKDLPAKSRPGLNIAAVLDREFPEDCLIAAGPISSIDRLPKNAKIATSSLRRAGQIKHLHPGLQILPLRGNVPTRIKKLDAGRFDAIILARAGLERLNLADRISFVFDPTEFIPAAAQGALAVQIRTDDIELAEIVSTIDDRDARTVCLTERQILIKTGAGCHAPVGAFAKIAAGRIAITAFISDAEGKNLVKDSITGPVETATKLAEKLAEQLLNAAGPEILESLK